MGVYCDEVETQLKQANSGASMTIIPGKTEEFSITGTTLLRALQAYFNPDKQFTVTCHDDFGDEIGNTFAWVGNTNSRTSKDGAYYDLVGKTDAGNGNFTYALKLSLGQK